MTHDEFEAVSSDMLAMFDLGFMISREGFNGECDYEHCAPSKLEPSIGCNGIHEFIAYMEENKTYCELREEAIRYIFNTTLNSNE